MAAGQWVRGVTVGEVAHEFDVDIRTAETWAATASRLVRLSIEGDREEIRARMLATLDTIIAKHAGGEPRAAVAAIELQAKLLGLTTAHVHVTGSLEQMARGGVEDRLRLARSVVDALESQKGSN